MRHVNSLMYLPGDNIFINFEKKLHFKQLAHTVTDIKTIYRDTFMITALPLVCISLACKFQSVRRRVAEITTQLSCLPLKHTIKIEPTMHQKV